MTTGASPTRARIVGIDLARFVAIAGMMAAHLISPLGSNPAAPAIDQALGKVVAATVGSTAATTFAVLGGVSLVLLSRGRRESSPGGMLTSIMIRGALIALIGALLVPLDGPISVVLTFYGVALILAAPALLLPSWSVAALAAVLWLGGGAVNAQLRASLAAAPPATEASAAATVGRIARDLLITGHYPAVTWVAYMLVGILIARMLLAARSDGTLRSLCTRVGVVGLVVYLAITAGGRLVRMKPEWFGLPDVGERMLSSGYGAPLGTELWMLLVPTPHSGNPADMLRTVAGACFIIGLLVGIFDARARSWGLAVQTVRAAGAAPLTIYTAHVVVTAGLHHEAMRSAVGMTPQWYAQGTVIFLVQLLGALMVGLALALLQRRGPLESLLGWVSGTSRAPRLSTANR